MSKKEWKCEDRPKYCIGCKCTDFVFDSEETEYCGLQDEKCPYDKGELQEITSKDVGNVEDILNPI